MELRRARVTSSVRTEGGLLPADLLAKVAAGDRDVPGLADADYALAAGDRVREAITRSWNRLVGSWAALTAARVGATDEHDPLTSPTRERWLLPLFEELGFGRLTVAARAVEIEGTAYPISHTWEQVPIHLVGFGVELDRRTPGVRGAAGAAPHALVQEYLNRSDAALWGIVSNGRLLRLLRDSTSLTRQAFVEFDLEAIFEGELYADFALLWSVCHRTRFGPAKPEECLLERWSQKAADDGTRALDKLRGGVEQAIETLGTGFLAQPTNVALREALRSGALDRQDYYRELLRLVYRLIFLFTAEDRRDETTGRELLLDPAGPDAAAERYRRYYSTARLRGFAGRRRGTRHPDLWVSLRRVIAALGGEGAPTLALPALGSFLFGPTACPHLDTADLRNEDLLDTVRALATIEEDRRLRLVDYRNLGAEELGGIYEGLLELHPRIEVDATPPRFTLGTAAGNERKATGSYYTPTSLITCLLDSALDPVVEEAVRGKDREAAERAILELAIVDPAAGSGHFLVAAAHRLAKRLAAIRTGEGEPSPSAVRHALRDVIGHCIYAVDVNPMAVELCKVSLWLEALEPGRPLSFLDAHVKVGNSLLGTIPELVGAGIPDAAFAALTGDDKVIVTAWRNRNRQERDGQQALFEAPLEIPTEALAREVRSLDALPEETPEAVAAKAALHAAYVASADYRRARATLDAWCAAFVAPKTPGTSEITTATFRAIGTNPAAVPAAVLDLVEGTAAEYAFFHWPLEFPAVFERGGFDVVVGNPPWERVKLQEKEFFAERSPAIADARNAAERKRMIADLQSTDPPLWQAFQGALRRSDGESHLLRDSGRYPLAGRGDINTYAVFAELMRSVIGPRGRQGVILPTGIATDDTTKFFFSDLVNRQSLVSLFSFENEEFVFPGIHHAYRFCLLTLGSPGVAPSADLVFYARQVAVLGEESRHFTLTPEDFALLNPNTRTCPTFRSRRDAELAKSIYRRIPVLIDEAGGEAGNPWGLSFLAMFHMANDSGLFLDQPGSDRLSLYEAKMIHQFDHRWATYEAGEVVPVADDAKEDARWEPRPQYWVHNEVVAERLSGRWDQDWLLGWRDITGAEKVRTVIANLIPRAAVNNKFLLMLSTDPLLPWLLAILDSFVLDWISRQKIGGMGMSYFVMKQLPVPTPTLMRSPVPWADSPLAVWVRPYLAELVGTSDSMLGLLVHLGWTGQPFAWDPARRHYLRAELDAAFFKLYGLSREEVAQVMDSFWIVRDRDEKEFGSYRTKDLILHAYDAIAEATPDRPFVSRLEPPPGDPHAAHPPRPGEEDGRWIPWSELVSRPRERPPEASPRSARSRRSVPARSLSPAPQPERRPAETRPPLDPPAQQTLAAASDPAGGDGQWRPETAVDLRDIVMGMRVRHRSNGSGIVLSVKPTGKGAELLIRFDVGGEKWIVFGYGVLEFADDTAARGEPA
jgi:N-6 DNA Methylase